MLLLKQNLLQKRTHVVIFRGRVALITFWAYNLMMPNGRKRQNPTQSFTSVKHTSHSNIGHLSFFISYLSSLELEYEVCISQGTKQVLYTVTCPFRCKSLCSSMQRIPSFLLSGHHCAPHPPLYQSARWRLLCDCDLEFLAFTTQLIVASN